VPTTPTNDINTYYEIHGHGKPLAFIHGAGASHRMWNPQVEHFCASYKVLTYDLRGHALSGGSDQRYSCELFADDLHALLGYLDLEKPLVCGLSLGGMVAQEYAVKYRRDLRALVLADTAVSSALTWSDKLQKTFFPKSAIKLLIRWLSRERYAALAFSFFRDIKPEVKEYLIEEHLKSSKEELLKATDAIYDFGLLDLTRITVPTLIIVGEWERKAVFVHAEKMRELIDDSRIVIIDHAMHASNLENPRQFNDALEDFFSRLPA
jgi:pimeloyl-ACP methyl ester carboxylesterase